MHLLPILFLTFGATAAGPGPATPELVGPGQNESCLDCHSEDLELDLDSGEEINFAVDGEKLDHSIHGEKLGCVDCHVDLKGTEGAHPRKRLGSAREFTVTYSKQCERCHLDEGAQVRGGVHHPGEAGDGSQAAVCADCHGAHEVERPAEARAAIARSCNRCHEKVAETYAHSVHGAGGPKANPDLPVCTDCHRGHDFAAPGTGAWKLSTPELCGKCHGDEAKMQKYGLSTDVMRTYVDDFHGMTAHLLEGEEGAAPAIAVCTDCHGTHDIQKADAPGSRVLKANLVETCRKCHPDANENFPGAWLSHQVPSFKRTPLVASVRFFYMVVIPFMIGGLVLQIGLHLWRVVVKR
jgi:predicted CXXCH cytochrome family protein